LISVVIPAYNEERRILPTLEMFRYFIAEHPDLISEIVVVDDGSRDQTGAAVMSYTGKLPLLRLVSCAENGGKWSAVHEGIRCARSDWVLLMDADGSASIWNFEKRAVRSAMRRNKSVFGSRFMKGADVVGKSRWRLLLSHGYRLLVNSAYTYATGRRDVDDMQCPWKLFKKSNLIGELQEVGFCGDLELACMLRGGIVNIPVDFIHQRDSRVRPVSILQMFFDTVRVADKMHVVHKRKAYKLNKVSELQRVI
jgi:dolichyl-phosphate beta-glucosyltransferase